MLRMKKCPGPTVGAVFVTMNPEGKRRISSKKERRYSSQDALSVASDNTYKGCAGSTCELLVTDSPGRSQLPVTLHRQCLLPSLYQPSRAAQFQQLFLGHFISSFDNRSLHRTRIKPWCEELPTILSTSTYNAVQDSIRATTMLHYGVMTANISVQTEAYKWYAKALEGQRTFLQDDQLALPCRMPTGQEILSPVVLALFEMISSTTPTGWMEHNLAAATMLQIRQPENCQDGLTHLLFRTVRMAAVSSGSP